jgi:hypothetical protein
MSKTSFATSQQAHYRSISNTNRLILVVEEITVNSENYMKPKNIFSGTIHILLNAKAMERKVITVP